MDDSIFKGFREINRQHFHQIWKKAQKGELQTLTEEEQRIGKIMLDHSDEYFNQFEFADVLADHQYDPETETNPFLHVAIHAVAEKQVQDRDPIEAFQFYNAMLHNKCSRHDAIHLLGDILIRFTHYVLKENKPFPLNRYCKTLKELKSRKPEKIPQLLEDIEFYEEQQEYGKSGSNPKIERFLAQLKRKHPHLRAYEEDDLDWWEDGMTMLELGDLKGAEKKFEQLILAEPEHHDGYEGLAMVYQRKGKKEEALLLIEHALTLAKGFFEDGTLDQEILDEMEEKKQKIFKMK